MSTLKFCGNRGAATSTVILNGCHSTPKGLAQVAVIDRELSGGIYLVDMSGPDSKKHKRVLKCASGLKEIRRLELEYEFYAVDLLHLQGTVVPKCFGFYKGKKGGLKSDEPLAVLVLEFVTTEDHGDNLDEEAFYEFHRRMMDGFCKLHQAGVFHGALMDGSHLGHVGLIPRIISFSRATRHRCQGCPPTVGSGLVPAGVPFCKELFALERTYGVLGSNLDSVFFSRASGVVNKDDYTAILQEKSVDDQPSMGRLGQVMARLRF